MAPDNKDDQVDVWNQWGKKDPYFSVIAHDLYRFDPKSEAGLSPESLSQFYESGDQNLDFVFDHIRKMGGAISGYESAMDYGCGVGRLSLALSKQFSSVHSLDISQNHLDIAEKNLTTRFNANNVTFFNVSSPTFDWQNHSGSYDFIITLLVLQHIPIQLLQPTIEHLFKSLKKDGVIAMQIPVFHEHYDFSTGNYTKPGLTDPNFLANGISEFALNQVARKHNLVNVGTIEWDCVGSNWLSKLFVFKRS